MKPVSRIRKVGPVLWVLLGLFCIRVLGQVLAINHGRSHFLTYHRFASRRQVEACYPLFPEFLRLKRKYDPEERFQSDWYAHHWRMFADVL